MRQVLRTLYYQSESHADLADIFVAEMARAAKASRKPVPREILDQIPLPFELTRPQAGAEIVSFSLFRKPRHR
jgi:hypothetical protein